ncbi:hypothetical protein ACPV5V_14105 [Vibrio campbellii]
MNTTELHHLKPENARYLPQTKTAQEYEKMIVSATSISEQVCKVEEERGRRYRGKFLGWMPATTLNRVKEILRTQVSYIDENGETRNFYFYDYQGFVNVGDSVTMLFMKTNASNVQQFIGMRNNTTGEAATFLNKDAVRQLVEHEEQKKWNVLVRLQQFVFVALLAWLGFDLYNYSNDTGLTSAWEAYYMYLLPFCALIMWLWNGYGWHFLVAPLREARSRMVRHGMANIVFLELGENIAVHRLHGNCELRPQRVLKGILDQEPCHY